VSYAPNTPTWAAPSTGAAANVGASLLLDWNFTDVDPGDVQSAYALSRQIGAGALNYWRASDSTWQVAEVKNVSATSAVTLATAWAVHTDAAHTFKAKVWDSADLASAYSAGVVVIPSTPINPAITAPTAAQVLNVDHVTLTWTATEQTQYRIQLNVQGGGAQVYDSGFVSDSVTRSVLVPYTLATGTAWTLTLTTKNNEGLSSVAQTRDFSVTLVPPNTPTLIASPTPAAGYIAVKITNPGGGTAVASNEVWRRVTGTTTTVRVAVAVAANATHNDWRAVSGVSYDYQILVIGTNGTSATSAWTA
jgi:hypothetical protein